MKFPAQFWMRVAVAAVPALFLVHATASWLVPQNFDSSARIAPPHHTGAHGQPHGLEAVSCSPALAFSVPRLSGLFLRGVAPPQSQRRSRSHAAVPTFKARLTFQANPSGDDPPGPRLLVHTSVENQGALRFSRPAGHTRSGMARNSPWGDGGAGTGSGGEEEDLSDADEALPKQEPDSSPPTADADGWVEADPDEEVRPESVALGRSRIVLPGGVQPEDVADGSSSPEWVFAGPGVEGKEYDDLVAYAEQAPPPPPPLRRVEGCTVGRFTDAAVGACEERASCE